VNPAPHDAIPDALSKVRSGLKNRLLVDTVARLAVWTALWMAASYILDRGLFELLSFDLAEHLPGWARWGQPLAVLCAAITFMVGRIPLLLSGFSDSDMALALERRFGKDLGGRLITTIELRGAGAPAISGMSVAMIEATRSEAARLVGTLPVERVFDEGRPTRQAVTAAGASVGGYLALMGLSVFAWGDGMAGYHDSLWFWTERTLLGRDVSWPRDAFLRLADFPADGSPLRVGRGTSHQFRVEAHRLLVAGSPGRTELEACRAWLEGCGLSAGQLDAAVAYFSKSAHHGWRPATLFDLGRIGPPWDWHLPEPEIAMAPRPGEIAGAIDSLFRRFPDHEGIKAAAQAMESASVSFLHRRQVRLVDLPAVVEWLETDKSAREDGKHSRQLIEELGIDSREPGLYFRPVQHSGESLEIIARAGNFQTRPHELIVLPAPVLARMDVTEHRPAYLDSRVNARLDGQARASALDELASLRKSYPAGDRLMPRAEASVIEFPSGSGLSIEVAIQEGRSFGAAPTLVETNGTLPAHSIRNSNGAPSFVLEIAPIREERVVVLKFTDADGINGSRKLVLRPSPDQAPTLEGRPVEDLRETESGYLVTARARIPFRGSARDDHGLARIRHEWTVREIDRDGAAGSLAGRLASMLSPEPASRLPAALNLAAAMAGIRKAPQALRLASAVPLFARSDLAGAVQFSMAFQQGGSGLPLPRSRVLEPFAKKLDSLPPSETLRAFALEPDAPSSPPGLDFPVAMAGIATDPEGSVSRGNRFLVELMVDAEDLDLSAAIPAPHSTRAGPFILVVIPDDEMLELIQSDEMKLRERLVELRNELVPPDLGLRTPIRYLLDVSATPSDLREAGNRLDPKRNQADLIDRVLDDARRNAEEIERDFRRLTRQTGLCGFPVRDEKEKVARAIEKIHKEAVPGVRGAVEDFRKQGGGNESIRIAALGTCKRRSAELLAAIDEALNLMGGATDFDSELARLRGILREQESQTRRLEAFRKELVNKLLEDLLNPK